MNLYQCKLSVIKYIPNAIKDESINIGFIFHCWAEKFIFCKFSDSKIMKIKSLEPAADLDFIQALVDDIEIKFNIESRPIEKLLGIPEYSNQNLLNAMAVTHSNNLRFSEPKSILTMDMNAEVERLFYQYVGEDERQIRRKPVDVRSMRSALKKEFARIKLLDNVVKKDVKVKGMFDDEIQFDFKYLNGKTNYIQNLSFDIDSNNDVGYAKIWYTNFNEVKKKEDAAIIAVYCPPTTREEEGEFKKAFKFIEASADKLINYNNELPQFIQHVRATAHN